MQAIRPLVDFIEEQHVTRRRLKLIRRRE